MKSFSNYLDGGVLTPAFFFLFFFFTSSSSKL